MTWINEAERIMHASSEWNEQFYPRDYVAGHLYWTKAKLLADAQNFAEALGYVQKMHALANPLYYERQHQNERIDSLTALWSEK